MNTRRLFIALWPEAPVQAALALQASQLAGHCGGRCTATPLLHLTLAFLGDVAEARIPELIGIIDTLPGAAIDLHLSRFGVWLPPGTGWIGPGTIPDALRTLHQALDTQLRALGWKVEHRSFRPHITLVRRASRRDIPAGHPSLDWSARQLALLASSLGPAGPAYQIIHARSLSDPLPR